MPKRCVICGEEAKFSIKDTSEYYCEECAQESFSDISVLQKIEDRARQLKRLIDEQILAQDEEQEDDSDKD